MTIALRPAEPDDDAILIAIYGGTREDELAMTDWDDARKREFVEQQFRAQDQYYRANYANATFDVILVDGQPAGRLYVARWPDEIRIMDIALLASFRGRGIGSHLLGALQREAAAAQKPLRIHVERFNPALSLYARLGFRLLEDRGVYLFLQWSPDDAHLAATAQENTAS
ncbi:MAG: GNAT family N-acetyltransferase [Chloroflexota bacterium]